MHALNHARASTCMHRNTWYLLLSHGNNISWTHLNITLHVRCLSCCVCRDMHDDACLSLSVVFQRHFGVHLRGERIRKLPGGFYDNLFILIDSWYIKTHYSSPLYSCDPSVRFRAMDSRVLPPVTPMSCHCAPVFPFEKSGRILTQFFPATPRPTSGPSYTENFLPEFVLGFCCQTFLLHAQPTLIFRQSNTLPCQCLWYRISYTTLIVGVQILSEWFFSIFHTCTEKFRSGDRIPVVARFSAPA